MFSKFTNVRLIYDYCCSKLPTRVFCEKFISFRSILNFYYGLSGAIKTILMKVIKATVSHACSVNKN